MLIPISDHPLNRNDGVLRGIVNPRARQSVLTDFVPIDGSKVGEVTARFDIVLGATPEA